MTTKTKKPIGPKAVNAFDLMVVMSPATLVSLIHDLEAAYAGNYPPDDKRNIHLTAISARRCLNGIVGEADAYNLLNPAPKARAVKLTGIQQKIVEYLDGKDAPSKHDLRCFAGMIQTGEASPSDFAAVDPVLMDLVTEYTAGKGWRET